MQYFKEAFMNHMFSARIRISLPITTEYINELKMPLYINATADNSVRFLIVCDIRFHTISFPCFLPHTCYRIILMRPIFNSISHKYHAQISDCILYNLCGMLCFIYPHQIVVTYLSDFRRGFGLANRFIDYSSVVTTINYNTFKITVIITHKYLLYLL
jgi:hypothetical protein